MELANSIVTLQPGMYILRHPMTGMPPISISKAAAQPSHNGHVQALYTPGTDGAVLRDGKDCIVMQVLQAPVDLLVTAYLERAGAAVPTLKIDKIRLDGDEVTASALHVPKSGMSLVGHIERTGDVLAKPGETLGKPSAELRLEGFQVMWPDKPAGLDIAYSVVVEGAGPSPEVTSGQFCGTKNSARRIVGLKLSLLGEKAGQYELGGKAHFSGGFVAGLNSGKAVAGPTGMEHLTALELHVSPVTKKSGSWDASSRTKIFKRSEPARKR